MAVGKTTLTVIDGDNERRQFASLSGNELPTGEQTPLHALCDALQNAINPARKEDIDALSAKLPAQIGGGVPVVMKGSVGSDQSIYAVEPVWPHIGQPIGNAGPFANWHFLGAVDCSVCAETEVQNYAGEAVLMLLDDGVAEGANPPDNATAFVLEFGVAGGSTPAPWRSATFRGRAQFYAQNALADPAYIAIRKH